MSKRRQQYNSRRPQEVVADKSRTNQGAAQKKPKSGILSASNKSLWWIALIPAAIMAVAAALLLSKYPHSIQMVEKLNFFVWTPEYINHNLAQYPAFNTIATNWIQQFFKESAMGVAIEAGLLALVALLAGLVPTAWKFKSNILFAIIPAVGLPWLFFHRINLSIEAICFFGFICLVGLAWRTRRQWLVSVALVVVGVLSLGLLSFPITVLLLVSLSVLLLAKMWIGKKTGNVATGLERVLGMVNIALPLIFIVLTVVAVKVSSETLGFIPLNDRWWYSRNAGDDEIYYVLFCALPLALMAIPRLGGMWLQVVLTVVACAIPCGVFYQDKSNNKGYEASENIYMLSDLAEEGRWDELLYDIVSKDSLHDYTHVQFALLAEAKLGTLPENLFEYPVNSPEIICPRFDTKPQGVDFCRLFYRELGFYDEAFHQAFEYGFMASPSQGCCTKSLRHFAEYSVKLGDHALAEKYLYLLDHTSNNADFVAEQRALLKDAKPVKDTIRAVSFVKAFPFNTEMAHYVDENGKNKAALDYLLCGLLLCKQLNYFYIIINDCAENYEGQPLPRAYAEAAAMINAMKPGSLDSRLKYDPEYDRRFAEFANLRKTNQNDDAFRGTFWYYHSYAQIPDKQGWMQSGGASTS